MVDLSTQFGQHVRHRLEEERIIWLTTISEGSMPQPRPVWFLWEGETFLIYSRPNTFKLQHIRKNPGVAINFDSDGRGGDIVVFIGNARIAQDDPSADQVAPYIEKYQGAIQSLQMTPEEFGKAYSVPIRVTPRKLRGH
jgi:PPOX class probable F420-dependent enzyme